MTRAGTRVAGAAIVAGLSVGACVAVALLYGITGYVIPWVWMALVSIPLPVLWGAVVVAFVVFVVTFMRGERRYRRGESR